MEVILRMPFINFSNANIQFADKEFIWNFYTIEKALSTTCQIKLVNKKEFVKAVLNENVETFVIYVALLISKMTIYLVWKAQIALLVVKKITVLVKYFNYTNVFSKKSAKMLPK